MQSSAQSNLIAIIPARGGSKGIPGKNIASVAGKPLIAYTIEAALAAKCIGQVIVTTDSPEIARVAKRFGAEVISRPADLSGDTASSESALLHALETLRDRGETLPELFVFLQCTSPLTLPEDIDGTVEALVEQQADTAFTAAPFHGFVWKQDADQNATGVNHDKRVRLRRQDKEPEFIETGAVYVMKTAGFLEHVHRFFGQTALLETPANRTLDIDDPADLKRADELLNAREENDLAGLLRERQIQALVMDFDGVLTDDCVSVDQNGVESVRCSRGDGLGLNRLRKTPVTAMVLSKEQNPVVSARCQKLQIECLQGIDEKLGALQAWCAEQKMSIDQVLYVGNDANDIECLQAAGIGASPADAHPSALAAAQIRLQHNGGDGAVREVCDALLKIF